MKKRLKKFAKGIIAVFTIKLILLMISATFQGCSAEENSISNINDTEFGEALDSSISKLNGINLAISNTSFSKQSNKSQTLYNKSETLYLTKDSQQDFSVTTSLNSIDNLNNLVTFKNDNNLELSEEISSEDDLIATFPIQEQQIIDALKPSIKEAKNYLLTKGFSFQEIDDMIIEESGTEEDLVPLVITMINEESNISHVSSINFSSLFGKTAYAQSWSDAGHCALAAIGADIIWSLGSDGGKWTKKAIKKAFGAVAKRLLGPIGVAIAVVSFGICMADAALEANDNTLRA